MTTLDTAILLLRLGVGITFAAHGAQKAFGWWGGPGQQRWQGAMESMGFKPAPLFGWASTLAELVGGLLLIFGLLTPLAAAVLVAQSIVIIFHAHWPKGFWAQQGGFEFPLVLLAGVLAIGLVGPAAVSVDHVLGLSWATNLRLVLLGLGIVAGIVSFAVPRVAARQEPAAHAS